MKHKAVYWTAFFSGNEGDQIFPTEQAWHLANHPSYVKIK